MMLLALSTVVFFVMWLVILIQYKALEEEMRWVNKFLDANQYDALEDSHIENLPGKYVMLDEQGIIDYDAELQLLMTRSHDRVGVVIYYPGN